jgi:hypothetical protein
LFFVCFLFSFCVGREKERKERRIQEKRREGVDFSRRDNFIDPLTSPHLTSPLHSELSQIATHQTTKQPRSYAKVPKQSLSGKGSDRAMTTRRWAWKQPSFEESFPLIFPYASAFLNALQSNVSLISRNLSFLLGKANLRSRWEIDQKSVFLV